MLSLFQKLIGVAVQALIRKYPNIQSKTESIQIPFENLQKSDISQLLIFFQYHLFAKSKEEIKTLFYFEMSRFQNTKFILMKTVHELGELNLILLKTLTAG